MKERSGGSGTVDCAAAALLAAGIAARTKGSIIWCLTRPDLFFPALAQVGLRPDRVIFVESDKEEDVVANMPDILVKVACHTNNGDMDAPTHTSKSTPELLFLHALPLDGSMWDDQRSHLSNVSYAPDLYVLGDTVGDWAREALISVRGNRLIVVGCSVGGSCALEVARIAPDRVAALVLIGTKAVCRPDPEAHQSNLGLINEGGLEAAWGTFWQPLFSCKTDSQIISSAKSATLRQSTDDIRRGVTAFHTRSSRDDVLTTFEGTIVMISGSDDVAPGVVRTMEQAESARNAVTEIIPDCGHYVPLEAPDQLNRILDGLLASL
jgi:pimeloyl-ACP methyl ester carboxylesterase